MTKKFIVLDVEGMSNKRPYNIGYIVADRYGNIYKKRSIAILSAIIENLNDCEQAKEMTHKNIIEILHDIENEQRKYYYCSANVFKRLLFRDIEEFGVSEIWAYNCTFDKSALKRLLSDDFKKLEDKVAFYDIIPAILYTKLLNKKYVMFCKVNGYVTQKGNVQYKAEYVYQYLTGKTDFVEEHTGLADVMVEYEILLTAFNTKKKIEKKCDQPWKVLKTFCEEKNIQF